MTDFRIRLFAALVALGVAVSIPSGVLFAGQTPPWRQTQPTPAGSVFIYATTHPRFAFWRYGDGFSWMQYNEWRRSLATVRSLRAALVTANRGEDRVTAAQPSETPPAPAPKPAKPAPAPAPKPAPSPPPVAPTPEPEPAPEPAPEPPPQEPEPQPQPPQPTPQPPPQQPAPQPTPQPPPQQPAPQPTPQPPPQQPAPQPLPAGLTAEERQMVELVNAERAKAGLKPLQVDMRLVQTARVKSQDMVTHNYFSHDSPRLGSPFDQMKAAGIRYTTAGENLAGNPSVDGAHRSLMNSSGHRANILSNRFTKIGVGIIKGGKYGMMFTQQFIAD